MRRDRTQAADLALLAQQRDAAVLGRDQHVPGAHLRDAVERQPEVLFVVELLADERLRLTLVRRDEERLRLDAEPHRLALGVDHDGNVPTGQVARGLGIEVVGNRARQRAREDDELGALCQVVQLLEQQLRAPRRAPPAPTR